jgi:hypothetical protein
VSLEEILQGCASDEDAQMTPKQRTLLALDVAAAILQLRETHWHRLPWDKSSIKLPIHPDGRAKITPFVEQSIDPRNAHVLGVPAAPEPKAALLELAILLLEIWHQRPIDTWAVKSGIEGLETSEMRRIAAIRWLELTSQRLPLLHLTAVEQCLAISSGRLRFWHDGEFLMHYCENIIRPLQESCKAW